MPDISKVALFTNEYPPNVYGGAGVHVEYLSQELAKLVPVEVRCFGDQDVQDPNLRVKGYSPWSEAKKDTDPRFGGALDAMYRSLAMAKDNLDASVVHSHTWNVQFAGFIAKKLWGIPFVLTTHVGGVTLEIDGGRFPILSITPQNLANKLSRQVSNYILGGFVYLTEKVSWR